MNKLYNEELKEKYLLTYDNEQTQNTIRNVFSKTALIENILDKDIHSFDLNQLGKAIGNTAPFSPMVARSNGRFISQYISWANENGYRSGSNINPLTGISHEWYDQFVDKTKKIHFSYDEFYDGIVESELMVNDQDKALLSLLFEGISGRGFSELNSIHYDSVNWNTNEIAVENNEDGELRERTVAVSDRTMKYLEDAFDERTYLFFNEETGDYTERELVNSEYLFRNIKSQKTKEGEPISKNVFYGRMKTIRESQDISYLTPNAIKQSGQLYMAYQIALKLFKEGKEPDLGYEELALIGEKYDLSKINSEQDGREYSYYNTHLMRQYLKPKTIKELYGLDIIISRR